MQGKMIILAVSGGIACYKAAALASKLTQAGADVHVVMTASACEFVTPLTFQALTRNAVHTDLFKESNPRVISHIDLADRADLFVLAPATANMIAKMANGIADDMVTTTWLATTAPTIIAPAMNGHMLAHQAVQANLNTLRARGARIVESEEGQLACGYVGNGRLAEPETIFADINRLLRVADSWRDVRVLVSAGGTREAIDPVRFIGNRSSGKMGHALAIAAAKRGADVLLVTTAEPPVHPNLRVVSVESAAQMKTEVMRHAEQMHLILMAAAVADYRPIEMNSQKLKKSADRLTLELQRTDDILAELGAQKGEALLLGFAAETEQVEAHAMDKLIRKNCDYLVANDVSLPGAGFSVDTNIVSIFHKSGHVERLPMMRKTEIAEHLLDLLRKDVRI